MNLKDFDISKYGTPVFFFLPNDSPQSQRVGIIFRDNEGTFSARVSYFAETFYDLVSGSSLPSFDAAHKRVFSWNLACKSLSAPTELEDMPICYATKPGHERFPFACFSRWDDIIQCHDPEVKEIPAREIPSGTAINSKLQWLFYLSRGFDAMYEEAGIIRLK